MKPDRRKEVQHVFETWEITEAIYEYQDSLPLCPICKGWGGAHSAACLTNPGKV